MPTLEEVKAAEAKVQKEKDDKMKEYLTIPPEGKPPNQLPPDINETQPELVQRALTEKTEQERLANEAKSKPHSTAGQKPKDDNDDDDKKPKTHTIGGKR